MDTMDMRVLLYNISIEECHSTGIQRVTTQRLLPLFYGPGKNGLFCPVLNLRSVNKHITTTKIQMATLQPILPSLKEDNWFQSDRLKNAFFRISVRPEHHFFHCCFQVGHRVQLKVLPFSLSIARKVFRKCVGTNNRLPWNERDHHSPIYRLLILGGKHSNHSLQRSKFHSSSSWSQSKYENVMFFLARQINTFVLFSIL